MAFRHDSPQHQLSDFLNAELLHTLGAYQLAGDKLEELHENIGNTRADTSLREVVITARQCNKHLREGMHHPPPADADWGSHRRYPSPVEELPDSPNSELLLSVSDFYATATSALRLHLEAPGGSGRRAEETAGHMLGKRLAYIHDPQRRGEFSDEYTAALLRGRLARTERRLTEARDLLPQTLQSLAPEMAGSGHADGEGLDGDAREFHTILHDHMGVRGSYTALHLTILEAMSDAHMWMHQAEHLRAQTFGTMFTHIPTTHTKIRTMLRRSIVLNTFVYVTARTAPWVFAENAEECDYVRENYEECCNTLTPTYCMWISNHLHLIALQRRAYTWWTLGHRDNAYRDFYKLTRLLRGLRQRVGQRAVRVPGTKTLIEGLTGIAEHHIGRIYRGQHAHRVALRYFDRAAARLVHWEDHPEISKIVKNSRWRLNLLISQGKASYELGQVKMSLLYYARAWRAFLLLAESESHSTANVDVADKLIEWLEEVKDDPELSKTELSRRLQALVKQFETMYSPMHLRLLAADIMMRLGHLLFILKLPPEEWVETDEADKLPPAPDHVLAHRCLRQAAVLDPTSTLIAGDLLKIDHAAKGRKPPKKEEPRTVELQAQWPSGGGRFEEAARIIEYILQKRLIEAPDAAAVPREDGVSPENAQIARDLLGSFLAHTDSSNVKLAQVYRYLMHEPRAPARDGATDGPTIDIVCLRRYSSFFPFLPRPAAFRALGGGYLVQVRNRDKDAKPFGIAIDPGPDFLDNLYRCGYALADIQMIVLTHDHADHMASVDALLALMGIRMELGDDTFDRDSRLIIVGNKSVVARYGFFNRKHPVRTEKEGERKGKSSARGDAVRVMSFEDFHKLSKRTGKDRRQAAKQLKVLLEPHSLCIEPIQTIDHYDATGNVSQGFMLRFGHRANRSSVLFTGDTGPVPGPDDNDEHHFSPGAKGLKDAAVEADLVVAHLSSVPLRELRKLASLEPGTAETDAMAAAFKDLWETASTEVEAARAEAKEAGRSIDDGAKEARFLLRQLQFGFRSRSKENSSLLSISPLSPIKDIKGQSEKHLYLTGLLDLAQCMQENRPTDKPPPLLLIGELREELGTFRTQIASRVTKMVFGRDPDDSTQSGGTALTADIGLRVRLSQPRPAAKDQGRAAAAIGDSAPEAASVLCTTCDLDNDLIAMERFHSPEHIREVCVKGENEGVFYNCLLHDPGKRREQLWVESVERYDVFGD